MKAHIQLATRTQYLEVSFKPVYKKDVKVFLKVREGECRSVFHDISGKTV